MKNNSRPPVPQPQVLEWLQSNHPTLHAAAECDRSWVWIAADLRTDPQARQSIKDYGFVFRHGGHPLPSGKLGTWGHSCGHPIPFYRKGKGAGARNARASEPELTDADVDAFLQEA